MAKTDFESIAKILEAVVKKAVRQELSEFKKEFLAEQKTITTRKAKVKRTPSNSSKSNLVSRLQEFDNKSISNSEKINKLSRIEKPTDILSEIKNEMQNGIAPNISADSSNPYETVANYTSDMVAPSMQSMKQQYMSEMGAEFGGNIPSPVMDTQKASTIQAVKNSGNESKARQASAVENALTRDYSSLIKKIEEKKGKK